MEARILKERLTSLPELEKSSAEHEELLRKRDRMEEDLRTYERTKAVRVDVERMSRELAGIASDLTSKNEQISPMKRSAEGLRTVLRSLEDVDGSMSMSRERSSFLVSEIKRTNKEIDVLKKKSDEIADLGPESTCPTCERVLGDHHQHLRDKLGCEMEEMIKSAAVLEDEAKVLKEEMDHISKRKVALEERKKKLTEESYQAERLRSMIDSLSERQRSLQQEMSVAEEKLRASAAIAFDEKQYSELRSRMAILGHWPIERGL